MAQTLFYIDGGTLYGKSLSSTPAFTYKFNIYQPYSATSGYISRPGFGATAGTTIPWMWFATRYANAEFSSPNSYYTWGMFRCEVAEYVQIDQETGEVIYRSYSYGGWPSITRGYNAWSWIPNSVPYER